LTQNTLSNLCQRWTITLVFMKNAFFRAKNR
jgi:hypothetical protein